MALKTPEKTDPPTLDNTVLLELALYSHYTWGGITYEKGNAYRFRRDDAMQLISEQDHGRPIWRMYTPPKPKTSPRMPIVDSTEVKATRTRTSLEEAERLPGSLTPPTKRIDVGTEDEIAEILNRPDADTSGDVTV